MIKEWIKKNFTAEEFRKASDEEKEIILNNRENIKGVCVSLYVCGLLFYTVKLLVENAYKDGFFREAIAMAKTVEMIEKIKNEEK